MIVKDKVVVVTGAAHGIGAALARRFKSEGARTVVASDLDSSGVEQLAFEIGAVAMQADVSREADVKRWVKQTLAQFGHIDLFCSNAGISIDGGPEVPDDEWARIRGVNVMAHIYAARAVLPAMVARGEGYLLQTVSAAGLLTSIGSALYAVTKHAALGLAEWLSIHYGGQGIKGSALVPQGVRTDMLLRDPDNFLVEGSVSAEQVADAVIQGLAAERFLILPHPEVAEYFRRKATDYDRWLRGMRRLRTEADAKKQKAKAKA